MKHLALAMLGKLVYITGLHSANAVDVENCSLRGRNHLSEGAGPQPDSTIRATWVSKEANTAFVEMNSPLGRTFPGQWGWGRPAKCSYSSIISV